MILPILADVYLIAAFDYYKSIGLSLDSYMVWRADEVVVVQSYWVLASGRPQWFVML